MSRKAAAGLMASLAGWALAPVSAQVVVSEDFESGAGGWLVNGQPTLVASGGNPGGYLGLPLGDFWGVTLRCEEVGHAVTGDLTRHGGPLTFSFDVNIFQLNNFFGSPIDPGLFPLVIEFVDYPAPGSPDPMVSVYHVGPGLPPAGTWGAFVYEVPDPTQTALPPGWGGTGAEDPITFEPILPPNRTYRSVMENVDEVRMTTMVPGFFYISNFWEAGFDNLKVVVEGAGCYPDCNADAVLTVADFGCFQTRFVAADPYADCNGDSLHTVADFGCFQTLFVQGCP